MDNNIQRSYSNFTQTPYIIRDHMPKQEPSYWLMKSSLLAIATDLSESGISIQTLSKLEKWQK